MLWQIESMGLYYDANEGSVIYFDPNSGDTHLITSFAAFVIQQFSGPAMATEELLEKLSPHIDTNDTVELQEAVSGVLEELQSLDILQQI